MNTEPHNNKLYGGFKDNTIIKNLIKVAKEKNATKPPLTREDIVGRKFGKFYEFVYDAELDRVKLKRVDEPVE